MSDEEESCTPPTKHKVCRHKHQRQGTGGVFYQSTGWLKCTRCQGWQKIRKPIKV